MKILLVEDEELLANNLKKVLESKGYNVNVITDGIQALQYIEENTELIDLVILDISLPGISGITICQRLRRQHIMIPILMLTARGTIRDKVTGLDYGADDYLPKPFSVTELLARIRALLRRPKQFIAKKIKIGDIEIRLENRKVFKHGKEIPLTLKEYELLQFFALHPNQVIDREQIVDKVWDMNFNSFSNVIDVHMANLRKKLQDSDAEKLIETVRGIGYRFNTGET